MTEKHRYYEFIKAYIEGKEVEYKYTACDFGDSRWEPVPNLAVFEWIPVTFRIKPQKKKSVGYMCYKYKQNGKTHIGILEEGDCYHFAYRGSLEQVEFIDNEWQYEEYEE